MQDKKEIRIAYSTDKLNDMRFKNGVLNKEKIKLQKLKPEGKTFIPILPANIGKDELRTLVDLAAFAGCTGMILPPNPYFNTLSMRAAALSAGKLDLRTWDDVKISNDGIIYEGLKDGTDFNVEGSA